MPAIKSSISENKRNQINGSWWSGVSSKINGLAISVLLTKKLIACMILVTIKWCLSTIFWWIATISLIYLLLLMSVQEGKSMSAYTSITSSESAINLKMLLTYNSILKSMVFLTTALSNSRIILPLQKLRNPGFEHKTKICSKLHQLRKNHMIVILNASMLL